MCNIKHLISDICVIKVTEQWGIKQNIFKKNKSWKVPKFCDKHKLSHIRKPGNPKQDKYK